MKNKIPCFFPIMIAVIIGLALFIVLGAKGDVKSGRFVKSRPDSIYTLKLYVAFPQDSVFFDPILRVTKDTVDWVQRDSSTKKKKWYRDTLYWIPMTFKDSPYRRFIPTLKESVYPGEDFNLGVKTLHDWIKKNPQYFKKP